MCGFMDLALEEAYTGIRAGDGGPFGAVVVKDGCVIGRGHNCVVSQNDPTLHGEVAAIRDACKALGSFDLSGCDLYTTAEPCPMCLGACLWAGIRRIYYGCTRDDSADIGFRDSAFYEFMRDPSARLQPLDREKCLALFDAYRAVENKTMY